MRIERGERYVIQQVRMYYRPEKGARISCNSWPLYTLAYTLRSTSCGMLIFVCVMATRTTTGNNVMSQLLINWDLTLKSETVT